MRGTGNPLEASLDGVNGFDIPQDVQDFLATLRNDGPVNAIDPDFEIPSQYRWNLGLNHTLPWDIELKADIIYSRVKDEVLWQDIRLQQVGTAPDGRPIYGPRPDGRSSSTIQDFLLTNTSEGEQTVFTIDASKTWRTGGGPLRRLPRLRLPGHQGRQPGHQLDGVVELGQRRRLRPQRPGPRDLELRDRAPLHRVRSPGARRSSATTRPASR